MREFDWVTIAVFMSGKSIAMADRANRADGTASGPGPVQGTKFGDEINRHQHRWRRGHVQRTGDINCEVVAVAGQQIPVALGSRRPINRSLEQGVLGRGIRSMLRRFVNQRIPAADSSRAGMLLPGLEWGNCFVEPGLMRQNNAPISTNIVPVYPAFTILRLA